MEHGKFLKLYSEQRKFVQFIIRRNGAKRRDIDDVSQELWIKLMRMPDDRCIREIHKYLKTCAIQANIDWHSVARNAVIDGIDCLSEDISTHECLTTADEALASIEKKELRNIVWQTLNQLPPRQKDFMVLHHFRGMQLEQIAAVTGCSLRTVARQLMKATRALRMSPLLAELLT